MLLLQTQQEYYTRIYKLCFYDQNKYFERYSIGTKLTLILMIHEPDERVINLIFLL
jgi:hypothetical protein